MHKRTFPAALRFHKPNKENSPHKYFLSELMLYVPFRDEEKEFRPFDPEFIEQLYLENKERIRKVKNKIMEHLESVEEARHYVEEVKSKLDLTNIGISLDATAEHENAECQEEIEEIPPDYLHLDIENLDIKETSENIPNIYRKIPIPDINELKKTTCQLDPFQRHVIDIDIKYAKGIIKSKREGN